MDHETQAKQKTMKNVMRGLAALMVPLTASFPVAIFAYWIPSNIFTFIQVRWLGGVAVGVCLCVGGGGGCGGGGACGGGCVGGGGCGGGGGGGGGGDNGDA